MKMIGKEKRERGIKWGEHPINMKMLFFPY